MLDHLKSTDYEEKSENNEMSWIEPKYTKKAISRAGEILTKSEMMDEEYSEAMNIVSNWRASYAFPLKTVATLLRNKATKIEKNALITQRLKRIPSILKKLERFKDMKLHRMQDIGGCRVVLSDIKNVYALRDSLINSKTKNELTKEDNYIQSPKQSGYRGIHLIYKYQGRTDNILYDGHTIEIQIRTKVQHAWATSVEIIGTFTKEALKSGEGSEKWLIFFRLVSILFSVLEDCTPEKLSVVEIIKIKSEVKQLEIDLDIFNKLRTFSVSTDILSDKILGVRKSGYFILLLRIDKKQIQIWHYDTKNLTIATEQYISLEKEYKNNKEADVVLVAAESIKSLKKAFPNYFADSEIFLEKLKVALL